MPQHELRFLPRYRNPSSLVSFDERTEHRCVFILVVRGNSEFESKNRSINACCAILSIGSTGDTGP